MQVHRRRVHLKCQTLLTIGVLLSTDNLCKQFGPRTDPAKCLVVFLKYFLEKINLIKENLQLAKIACKIIQHAELKLVPLLWRYLYFFSRPLVKKL